jgi:hypothetical protein
MIAFSGGRENGFTSTVSDYYWYSTLSTEDTAKSFHWSSFGLP